MPIPCRAAAYNDTTYRHDRHADAYLFPNRFNAARTTSSSSNDAADAQWHYYYYYY